MSFDSFYGEAGQFNELKHVPGGPDEPDYYYDYDDYDRNYYDDLEAHHNYQYYGGDGDHFYAGEHDRYYDPIYEENREYSSYGARGGEIYERPYHHNMRDATKWYDDYKDEEWTTVPTIHHEDVLAH